MPRVALIDALHEYDEATGHLERQSDRESERAYYLEEARRQKRIETLKVKFRQDFQESARFTNSRQTGVSFLDGKFTGAKITGEGAYEGTWVIGSGPSIKSQFNCEDLFGPFSDGLPALAESAANHFTEVLFSTHSNGDLRNPEAVETVMVMSL
jgi:hypothetical protein